MRLLLLTIALFMQLPVWAQQPTQSPRVLGDVSSVDVANMQLKVKTSTGEYTVVVDEAVTCKRIAPDAKTLEGAEEIRLSDIRIGDRIWARNTVPSEKAPQIVYSKQLILMSGESIAERNRREREAWQRRSIRGEITAVFADRREAVIRLGDGQTLTVEFKPEAEVRIYPPDSVDFLSAKLVKLSELKVGDKLLARGDRSEDGTRFSAEIAVSGSIPSPTFGQIVKIDAEKGELLVRVQEQNSAVRINSETLVRSMPEIFMNPGMNQAIGRPQTAQSITMAGQRRMTMNPAVILEMLRRLPELKLTDLKVGEYILANGPRSTDGKGVVAIFVVRVPLPAGLKGESVGIGDFGGAFSNFGIFQ